MMSNRSPVLVVLAWSAVLVATCKAESQPDSWRVRAARTAESRLSAARSSQSSTDAPPSTGTADQSFVEPLTFSLAQDATTMPAESDQARQAATGDSKQTVERGPLPSFSDTVKRDLEEMPRVLWHDSKAAFGNPWNLVLLLSAGGASIALRTTNTDDHVAEHYARHPAFNGDWPDTFATIGNPAVHFALAGGWYLIGQQAQDAKTYEVGRKLFNALTITGTTTMFLKICAWDDSPNGEWGAWPSGHVSSTMAMATVLNDAYGPLVGVPMFGLTGLVAVERMDDREHWLSDVVFGAVLGWVVGETVMKEHRPEVFGGEVVPYVDPVRGGAGIGWLKNLGQPSQAAAKP